MTEEIMGVDLYRRKEDVDPYTIRLWKVSFQSLGKEGLVISVTAPDGDMPGEKLFDNQVVFHSCEKIAQEDFVKMMRIVRAALRPERIKWRYGQELAEQRIKSSEHIS